MSKIIKKIFFLSTVIVLLIFLKKSTDNQINQKNNIPINTFVQGNYDLDIENQNLVGKNKNSLLFTIQFFDWFTQKDISSNNLNPNFQTHTIDWNSMDISIDKLGTFEFYDKNFKLIKDTGIDSISWEFYKLANGTLTIPSEEAIKAVKKNNLKIGIFYDWEIIHASDKAQLSQEAYINPTQENIDKVSEEISKFYSQIPKELWFKNLDDQLIIFIYAFGYNKNNNKLEEWNDFYFNLNKNISEKLNTKTKIYLTGNNSIQQETAFINYPNEYEPFNFVLDQPQQLFGNDVVTWNFGFDNFGASKRDSSERMLRLDNRYWQQMFDLVKKQNPQIVFMYSWNEPFEGSTIIPATDYQFNRINFVKKMIDNLSYSSEKNSKSLVIIDDYCQCIISKDWHCSVQKEFMLYHLKRFFPNSDVIKADTLTKENLEKYQFIIDLSVYKIDKLEKELSLLPSNTQIIFFDPLHKSSIINNKFFTKIVHKNFNRNITINKNDCFDTKLFTRDDVANIELNNTSTILLESTSKKAIIVKNDNDYYINSYTPNYCILQTLSENIYSKKNESQILYGEGIESQNLVIKNEKYTLNEFSRPSIVESKLYIPEYLQTFPKEINQNVFNFLFYGVKNKINE